MVRKIGKVAGLVAGILLALFSAFQTLTFPNFLRGYIRRPWLHNIDVVPVDKKLFLICLAALIVCLVLDWLLLSRRLKFIPRSRIVAVMVVMIFFLVPLKNSALQPSLFFALGGLASVLIFVSTSGLQSTSLHVLQKAWAQIIGVNSVVWQALILFTSLAFYLCCSSFLFYRFGHGLDEIDYLFQARIFAKGHLWAPIPEPYDFFHLVNLVAKDGKWLTQYPPGWPALLAAGVRLGMAWTVNPLFGSLLVVFIYRLARALFDEDTARLASLLAVFSPYLIIMNSTMMSHTSCALAWILFLLLIWQNLEKKSLSRAFLAFLCLGIAMSIRPFSAFLVFLPGAGLTLYACRKTPRALMKLGLGAAAGLAIPLALLLYYNHLTTGSALVFGYQYLNSRTADLGFGLRQFPFPHTLSEGLMVFHSRMVMISEKLLETTIPALVFAVLAFILRKPDRKLIWLALIFLALPLGHIFYFGNDLIYPPRYIFEGVPGLIILCAAGINAARNKWSNNPGLAHYVLILAALAFFFFIPAHILSWRDAGDIGNDFPRLLKARQVKGALVLVEDLYYPMGMIRQSPFLDGDNIYARDLAGRRQEIIARFPGRPVWVFSFDRRANRFALEPLASSP